MAAKEFLPAAVKTQVWESQVSIRHNMVVSHLLTTNEFSPLQPAAAGLFGLDLASFLSPKVL